jgi:hypothetical protein
MALGHEACSCAASYEHDKGALPRHSLPTTNGSSLPQKLQQRAVKFLAPDRAAVLIATDQPWHRMQPLH